MNGRKRWLTLAATAAALLVLPGILAWNSLAGGNLPAECVAIGRLPRIEPDYSETVIPPNIAPLNFQVREAGVDYRVRIHGTAGEDIVVASRSASIVIPPRPWRELLQRNRGGRIVLDVYAKGEDGRWSRFDSIKNDVAREEIDSHLVYRLVGPLGNFYRTMGLYQRNLENYDESPIVTNDGFDGCVNCHSCLNNRADLFSLQFRAKPGKGASGMIVVRDGHARWIKTQTKATPMPAGYTSWHPSTALAAFAMGHPAQSVRGAGIEVRDVFDFQSDLAAVNVKTGAVSPLPAIADPDSLETFPAWSADGKFLYFTSVNSLWSGNKPLVTKDIKKAKYHLMRVRYDSEKGEWGEPEMVLSAADTGLSISEPRASPDGRYLLFCMSDYGPFPPYQVSSDLYLMDLKSGKYWRMTCNSPQCECWHSWSSNSRWIVFSSKRDTGLLARNYFSYVDAEGHDHKPFVLPQKDPTFYDTWLKTYNVPELISGPITVSQAELLKVIRSGDAATDKPAKSGTPVQTNGNRYQ